MDTVTVTVARLPPRGAAPRWRAVPRRLAVVLGWRPGAAVDLRAPARWPPGHTAAVVSSALPRVVPVIRQVARTARLASRPALQSGRPIATLQDGAASTPRPIATLQGAAASTARPIATSQGA